MRTLLKKRFWIVYAAAIGVCALFAARAASHVMAAKDLDEGEAELRPAPGKEAAPEATRTSDAQAKVGAELVERNMFCTACEPPEPEEPEIAYETGSGGPAPTDLPLRLIATTIAAEPDDSLAFVENTDSDAAGAYRRGDPIPKAGPVVAVTGQWVDFENPSAGRVERLELLGDSGGDEHTKKKEKKKKTRKKRRPKNKRGELLSKVKSGVKKVGDHSYEIERSLVNNVVANPRMLRGARIRPATEDGEIKGFKVSRVSRRSPLSKIGVKNGDVVRSVNGMALTSPDKALEVYTKVKSASSVRVQVTRRGKPITLKYSIN